MRQKPRAAKTDNADTTSDGSIALFEQQSLEKKKEKRKRGSQREIYGASTAFAVTRTLSRIAWTRTSRRTNLRKSEMTAQVWKRTREKREDHQYPM
jgi:hypothetical protein